VFKVVTDHIASDHTGAEPRWMVGDGRGARWAEPPQSHIIGAHALPPFGK